MCMHVHMCVCSAVGISALFRSSARGWGSTLTSAVLHWGCSSILSSGPSTSTFNLEAVLSHRPLLVSRSTVSLPSRLGVSACGLALCTLRETWVFHTQVTTNYPILLLLNSLSARPAASMSRLSLGFFLSTSDFFSLLPHSKALLHGGLPCSDKSIEIPLSAF